MAQIERLIESLEANNLVTYHGLDLADAVANEDNASTLLGESLFPNEVTDSLSIELVNGIGGVAPTVINQSAFGETLVKRGGAVSWETDKQGLPFFREGMQVNEQQIMDWQDIDSTNVEKQKRILDSILKIYAGRNSLLRSPEVTAEIMRWQVLTGLQVVNYRKGKPKYIDYAFGKAKDFKIELTNSADKWNVATSRPLDVLDSIKPEMPIKTLIFRNATLINMLNSNQIKEVFAKDNMPRLNVENLKDFLAKEYKCTVKEYNDYYLDEKENEQYFLKEEYVIALGQDKVGATKWGPTVERSSLENKRISSVETGAFLGKGKSNIPVIVRHDMTQTPPHITYKVSATVLPSFNENTKFRSIKVY